MSNASENFVLKLKSSYDFDNITAIIMDAIEIIKAKNPSADVSDIEEIINKEALRREKQKEEVRLYNEAWHPIETYVESLVAAAMAEMITTHGRFVIPGDYENVNGRDIELFFSQDIMRKYEIICEGSEKYEWNDEAQFSISPCGKLADQFKNHNINVSYIEVNISGEEDSDIVEIDQIQDIVWCLGKIRVSPWSGHKISDLNALAEDLRNNSNRYLLMYALRKTE